MGSEFALDSLQQNPPGTVRGKHPLDVELLLQWAIARSGRLPWDRTRDRELSFDQGLTARMRRRPPTNWTLAAACAGIRLEGRAMPAMMRPCGDAELVIEAVKRLEGGQAEIVIACARAKRRPDWFEGVEPQLVPRLVRDRRHHRQKIVNAWSPCSPAEIRAARERYRRWHAALEHLTEKLAGRLEAWETIAPTAPAEPWL